MKVGLFSMRDVKAESFSSPVAFPTQPLALRWFRDLLADEQSVFFKHPADFALHYVGDMDTESGTLYSREGGPLFLNYGSELLGPKGVE